ncbi:hypothetical protein MRB53_015091 [Persea americana]|uniref:Uncharacterized protein n=1 Tax=Persea americana TaxID=3435 RepID=A0ACC2KCR1_PERAE|nr:hypothetical protein MRB53_015091 [Persea americana]
MPTKAKETMETTNIKIWLQSQGGAASLHPTAKAVQFPGKAKGSKKMGSEMQEAIQEYSERATLHLEVLQGMN